MIECGKVNNIEFESELSFWAATVGGQKYKERVKKATTCPIIMYVRQEVQCHQKTQSQKTKIKFAQQPQN